MTNVSSAIRHVGDILYLILKSRTNVVAGLEKKVFTKTWTSVSRVPTLTVIAETLKGALTHGSRAHAAFALTIRRDGASIDTASVRLLARMPSHDRRMPGGHGPANDPDVQGIVARPDGQGRYPIPTVDFTMGGPWLFEVQLQEGPETHKAYFAAAIGEE